MPKAASIEDWNNCYLMVGRFSNDFSMLESKINHAMGHLLRLDPIEEAIATANMSFRDKISVIRTVLGLKISTSKFSETIGRIQGLSDTRNIIAHTPFGPTSDGDVRFLRIKAKSNLAFPETVFSQEKFSQLSQQAHRLGVEIETIINDFAVDGYPNLASLFDEPAELS